MTYKEFKETYRWICKNCPDTTNIFSDDLTEKICKVRISKQIKVGSKWKTTSEEMEEVTRKYYMNIVDAVPFFRNLGGSEYITKAYTKHGYIPVRIASTSPDRKQRTVREFSF